MSAVLALDLASVTGFALRSGDDLASGLWDLRPGRGRPHRTRWLNLWSYLSDMHLAHGIGQVVQEKPIVYPKRPSGALVAFGLTAMCQAWCEHKGIPWEAVQLARIKKHATGKGNADKEMMTAAAREKWPELNVKDHNEADALWLLDYFLKVARNPAS